MTTTWKGSHDSTFSNTSHVLYLPAGREAQKLPLDHQGNAMLLLFAWTSFHVNQTNIRWTGMWCIHYISENILVLCCHSISRWLLLNTCPFLRFEAMLDLPPGEWLMLALSSRWTVIVNLLCLTFSLVKKIYITISNMIFMNKVAKRKVQRPILELPDGLMWNFHFQFLFFLGSWSVMFVSSHGKYLSALSLHIT